MCGYFCFNDSIVVDLKNICFSNMPFDRGGMEVYIYFFLKHFSVKCILGHFSMIGTQTGKIVNFSIRSKSCNV